MYSCIENIIKEYIGFDYDWEIESNTWFNEENGIQNNYLFESRGASLRLTKIITFIKNRNSYWH